MFNALTLKVSDKDMANEIRKRQYQTFNDIFWYCFVGSLISVLYHLGLYVAGTGPLFMVIVGAFSFINQLCIGVAKWKKPEITTYFTLPYMINRVVCSCLFYHGYLGEWKDRTAYS